MARKKMKTEMGSHLTDDNDDYEEEEEEEEEESRYSELEVDSSANSNCGESTKPQITSLRLQMPLEVSFPIQLISSFHS